MLESKKVLVTGAGGFIGSHLAERLVDLGAEVTAFLRYSSRTDETMIKLLPQEKRNQIRIIYGELRQPELLVFTVLAMRFFYWIHRDGGYSPLFFDYYLMIITGK